MQTNRIALLLSMSVAAPFAAAWADPYSYTTIKIPGATSTIVAGINNVGQIAGTAAGPFQSGFVENVSGTGLITFAGPGLGTLATGINDLGQVSASVRESGNPLGVIYNSASNTSTTSQFPGGAMGIDNAGQITQSYFNQQHPGGYEVSVVANLAANTTIALPDPTQAGIFATGINNRGQVVGRQVLGTGFVFDLAISNYTILNIPGAIYTVVYGINDVGQVVGSYQTGSVLNPVVNAFELDLSTMHYTTLTIPGAGTTFAEALGINNAGQIVGDFIDTSGKQDGFLATPTATTTPVPEPATIALLGAGIVALARARRRSA